MAPRVDPGPFFGVSGGSRVRVVAQLVGFGFLSAG